MWMLLLTLPLIIMIIYVAYSHRENCCVSQRHSQTFNHVEFTSCVEVAQKWIPSPNISWNTSKVFCEEEVHFFFDNLSMIYYLIFDNTSTILMMFTIALVLFKDGFLNNILESMVSFGMILVLKYFSTFSLLSTSDNISFVKTINNLVM